jgi:anaerobic ribonucleoside-triphosphate reductase
MAAKEVRVPVEVYSRVVGYFRPVNQWNKGKKEEFSERRTYTFQLDPMNIYEYQRDI